jgi:hypothetical protein
VAGDVKELAGQAVSAQESSAAPGCTLASAGKMFEVAKRVAEALTLFGIKTAA